MRALEELRAQYNVLRTIQDPRIPTAIGLYEDVGALATTLVSGKPLSDAIDGRLRDELHMTPATLLDVLMELSEALARAHGRQCHHGRIDPSQVWLTDLGSLWVLGFGETRDGGGARQWLSPEQARGGSVGAWTDQWSLAALGTALITGQPLWAPHNPEEQARVGDASTSLTIVAQQWPALARVFHKMLDPDPTRRFSNMAAVRQELAHLARQAGNNSDRRALGAWLSARSKRPLPPISARPEDFEASTLILDTSKLPTSFGEPPLAAMGEFDSEVTAMTEVFQDGHVQVAEAMLTEPGEDPSLLDLRPVAKTPVIQFDPTSPGLHGSDLLEPGVTEVDPLGPKSIPSQPVGGPPTFPESAPVMPNQPSDGSGAVALWVFVVATLLVLFVGGMWLVASLWLMPEI